MEVQSLIANQQCINQRHFQLQTTARQTWRLQAEHHCLNEPAIGQLWWLNITESRRC